jgi:hypothetical protein
MRENGIRARHKRRFKATTDSKHSMPVADNLLARNFSSTQPVGDLHKILSMFIVSEVNASGDQDKRPHLEGMDDQPRPSSASISAMSRQVAMNSARRAPPGGSRRAGRPAPRGRRVRAADTAAPAQNLA